MSEFVLSCCSVADLKKEHFDSRNINYICFHFQLGDKVYDDDLGISIPFPEFYKKMTEGSETSTSQVNAEEYTQYFEKFLKDGKDILLMPISTGLSGSYNSAYIAKSELAEKYPDRKIYIVDSLGASSGLGLMIDKLADLRDEGKSIDEIRDWIEENKLKMHHWFFSSDLTFFIKGGRVSKTAGFIGGLLGICPLLNVDNIGKLIPREKIRTKKKVIKQIVSKMEEFADDRLDYCDKCFISHSDCEEDAKAVAQLVEEKFPKLKEKVLINDIGTTIGSHTGPGTVALFFWGDKREN